MDCTSCRSQFSEALDGRLDLEAQVAVDAHVAACPGCAAEQQLYDRVFSALRAAPPTTVPPRFPLPIEPPGMDSPPSIAARRGWRLGRVAAAVIITLGFVSSNVLLFRAGQESAGGDIVHPHVPSNENTLATAASMFSLPSELRDHVDASDLLVRTAGQIPDSMGEHGVDLMRADLARVDFAGLTKRIRGASFERAAGDSAEDIRRYLRDSEDLLARFDHVLSDPSAGVEAVQQLRMLAKTTPLLNSLEPMRAVVAPLAGGASFRGQKDSKSVETLFARLNSDEMAFLNAKHDRLKGSLRSALNGYGYVESRYADGPVAPMARYFKAETLLQMGSVADAASVLAHLHRDFASLPFMPGDRLSQIAVLSEGADRRTSVPLPGLWGRFYGFTFTGNGNIRLEISTSGTHLSTAPMPEESGAASASPRIPENVQEFCQGKNVVPVLTRIGSGIVRLVLLDEAHQPLAVLDNVALYQRVVSLLQESSRDDSDLVAPRTPPPPAPRATPPAPGAPRPAARPGR